LLRSSDVPPEQRNVYAHFELTEEEMRILKQNNTLHTNNQQQEDQEDELEAAHSGLREIEPAAAAASSSSAAAASSSVVLNPLGFPLKQEVKQELAEMDEVSRAAIGLRRLAEEEAAIFRNQLANLDGSMFNKQV
jgi:CHASE3 domain sensor protein